jgi:hypothetical protein
MILGLTWYWAWTLCFTHRHEWIQPSSSAERRRPQPEVPIVLVWTQPVNQNSWFIRNMTNQSSPHGLTFWPDPHISCSALWNSCGFSIQTKKKQGYPRCIFWRLPPKVRQSNRCLMPNFPSSASHGLPGRVTSKLVICSSFRSARKTNHQPIIIYQFYRSIPICFILEKS